MKCPNCDKSIFWLKVILISWFSNITCNACGIKINRKTNISYILLILLTPIVGLLILYILVAYGWVVTIVFLLVIGYIDSLLVTLVQVDK